ncbi:MAG: PilN domain-containing protein [Deltaproteobacteria bacterium]|jgi:Tfp pilus assembly protein PilN|nr:PilN domain-containing protein [Deltaproteobacteria bacterium]
MMIQINLLPLEAFRQTSSGRMLVGVFAVTMIGLVAALFVYYSMFMGPEVESLTAAQQAADGALKAAQGKKKVAEQKAKNFVADMVKVSVISDLEERRRDQARLLMAIASQVSNKTSWLVSCSHDKGMVRIRGMAIDHEEVAELLERLQKVPILQDVVLLQTAEDQVINGVNLVSFEFAGSTTFPVSSLMTAGLPSESLPPKEVLVKMVTLASPSLAEALKPKLDDKKKL